MSDPDAGDGPGPDEDREPTTGHRSTAQRVANEERRQYTPILSGITVIVGLWIILSGFVYVTVGGATLWNTLFVGLVVVLAAAYNYYRQSNDIPLSVGVATLLVVLGLWLIASTIIFDMPPGFRWSTAASGLIIAVLGGYNAYSGREARAVTTDSGAAR